MNCIFCEIKEYILENELCYAIYDKYPVSEGHMLIITKRHIEDYFETTYDEKSSILDLIDKCKVMLDNKYSPDGYNIGINCGKYAGQTVMHLHTHIIPRYKGDIDNPTGGVRGVIPNKRIY